LGSSDSSRRLASVSSRLDNSATLDEKKISSVIEKSSIPKLFVRVRMDVAGQRDCVVVEEEARRTNKCEIRKRRKYKPQI